MGHGHTGDTGNIRRILIALVLTGTFMLVEVAGGIIAGSLALLADAGHMLTDTMALGLAAVAFHVADRPADTHRSYGYQRFQILAAFVNGLTLLLIVGWILFEAVQRFMAPPQVMGKTMLLVAALGLVVNLISFAALHGGDRNNLNMRAAAIHVAGDLLGSVAAIAAALVIIGTGWMPIDPILSVGVALLILKSAWQLVRRSSHILLEGAPEWLDTAQMQQQIVAEVPVVSSIHHVHVWGLTPQHLMLTMHICVEELPEDATPIVRQVKAVLREHYGIGHSTIEIETENCSDN